MGAEALTLPPFLCERGIHELHPKGKRLQSRYANYLLVLTIRRYVNLNLC